MSGTFGRIVTVDPSSLEAREVGIGAALMRESGLSEAEIAALLRRPWDEIAAALHLANMVTWDPASVSRRYA
ncbi:lambda repressor-like predicted transcriptional regulator [Rhodoligotrophos appendicifer]|uniref:hypothetical protein n=1 Tax=Rhodoligotrophos appendicifer TaxID=987056 RepID=UPI0011852628|nr:hypothetical protein [Rhodoligotrophos appendicifer]